MRIAETKVYTFNELTDAAKEVARSWWRTCEASDPAWADEHAESVRAARKFLASYRCAGTVDDMKACAEGFRADPKQCCPWTGYMADEQAIDSILESLEDGETDVDRIISRMEAHMDRMWGKECDYQMEDSCVDENILANEYEFTANGVLF